jgi:cardiolipin synthase A/B
MLRHAVLAFIAVIAALLALSGCKSIGADPNAGSPEAPVSSQAGTSQAGTTAPRQSGPLYIEPGASFSPVYELIDHARRSVDVTMYEFADPAAEQDLAAAVKRGVRVEVILDQREQSKNEAAYQYLTSHGASVVWSSSAYRYTHQKTVVVDGTEAVIMTANLTSEYYSTSRDFLVADTDSADVAAIIAVFDADFAHRSVTPGDGADLVWSPTDSQRKLLDLINGATSSLRIYSEEMGDRTMENALVSAARRGVDVQVCGENENGQYDSAYAKLARAGVHTSYYSSPSGFYIHGKVIEADYGTSRAAAFIGSENFSATSLNKNRELGLITSAPPVLSAIAQVFSGDFQRGTHP